MADALRFAVAGSERPLVLADFDLVVAGYTGRDEASVRRHIDELAAIGVPPPDTVPAFYRLDPGLCTQADEIAVAGANTSGEVEPVLVRGSGRLYLTVGSDHTDRDIERASVPAAKAACPKPVARTVLPLPDDARRFDWDALAACCAVDGLTYQDGSLATLRRTIDVLELLSATDPSRTGDLVLFGGTLPLLGGQFVPGTRWAMSLAVPRQPPLHLAYRVRAGSAVPSAVPSTDPSI